MSLIISLINRLPFGHPAQKGFYLYTKIPPRFFDGLEESNFKQTIRYVASHSNFYKRKFKERGIDAAKINRPQDLVDFYTTAEDIRENPNEFLCAKEDTAYETTGTTSRKPKRVYFSRQEVSEAGWAGAVGLWGVGVRPADRIASAFDSSFWVSGPVLYASCQVLGAFHVEAGRLDPVDFYDRLKDYGITVLVGDPSWLLRLSEVAEKKGPWPIKLMIGGGENFTEDARHYCEKVWKADYILSYGQTEAFGAIGMESLEKDGYHLNQFHNYFEIINCDESGLGELVYTTLNRRVMPLVRYRSGDLTRFIHRASKSGMPGKRIEKLKGRVNEWIPTAIGNLAPWIFEEIFQGMEMISPDWQVTVDKKNNKDLIEIHVESAQGPLEDSIFKEEFLARMKKDQIDWWKGYQMGLFEMGFIVHPKGKLRDGRKLMRIVDRRKF